MPEGGAPPVTAAVATGRLLGAGGEAEVFEVLGRRQLAYKRYRKPSVTRAAKLDVMVAHPPAQAAAAGGHVSIAWPVETVRGGPREAVDGFLMPRVDLRRAVPLFQVYNPQSRRKVAGGFSWRYLLRTARNVAAIVASLHDAGYVIGDLNESNFLVTDRALVVLVDCDSMQVRDPTTDVVHRGAFGKPEFLAPELHGADLARTDRTTESDGFALAILVFLLLMEGLHPFAGIWRGRDEPPDIGTRIRAGLFPYRLLGRLRPPPLGLPMSVLPRAVRSLVWRTFTTGVRRPHRRPAAREWADVLDAAERRLRTCSRSPSHVFAGRWRRCPWCRRVDRGLPDPFPGADGSVVARREPPLVVRACRRWSSAARRAAGGAARSFWERAGARVRFDAGGAVFAAAAVWAFPPLALVAVYVLMPLAGWERRRSLRATGRVARARAMVASVLARLRTTWRRGCVVGVAVGAPWLAAASLGRVPADVATRATAVTWVMVAAAATVRLEPAVRAVIDRARTRVAGRVAWALWMGALAVATVALVTTA